MWGGWSARCAARRRAWRCTSAWASRGRARSRSASGRPVAASAAARSRTVRAKSGPVKAAESPRRTSSRSTSRARCRAAGAVASPSRPRSPATAPRTARAHRNALPCSPGAGWIPCRGTPRVGKPQQRVTVSRADRCAGLLVDTRRALPRGTDSPVRVASRGSVAGSAVNRGDLVQTTLVQDLRDGVLQRAVRSDDGLQGAGQQVCGPVPVAEVVGGDLLEVLGIQLRRVP